MFDNMKIGTRLALAFSAVLLVTLAISILSYTRMGVMNQNTDRIVDDLNPRTETARKIIGNVNFVSSAIRNTLLFIDTRMINDEIDRIHNSEKDTDALLDKLEARTDTDEGKALISKIKVQRQQFAGSLEKLIKLGQSDGAAATAYLISEFRPINDAYLSSINDLIEYQNELMKQGGDDSRASYMDSRNFLIVLTVLAVLISTALGIWIIRSIIGNLRRAVEIATAVSKGDLTQHIEVATNDEVGHLL